ncbi:MAG: metallophosphoesterase [Flavobacteriales bacterium]|nr:metallophosphoesterase [Flavobacteriales bacterium]MDW8431935.1 metallophosphoesterase [Flavobacteriales bacterium]
MYLPLAAQARLKHLGLNTRLPEPRDGDWFLAHATDLHVGQGLKHRDYGMPGFLDSLEGLTGGVGTQRLNELIEKLNAVVREGRKVLVILSGDLTDSGELSEFMEVRRKLNGLSVPWVPLMGNHDTWPYTSCEDEAPAALGDILMTKVFGDVFDTLKQYFQFQGDQRLKPCPDPLSGQVAYLQNFSFSLQGRRFIFLDFNPRYHVRLNEPGIGPEVCLHAQDCGTIGFLEKQLQEARKAGAKVTLISHHPPQVFKIFGKHYAFSRFQKKILKSLLKRYPGVADSWLCGHFHRSFRYKVAGVRVFETGANIGRNGGLVRWFILNNNN